MLGYTELNVNTTKNYPALTSYFTDPSFKTAILLEIPLRKSDNVSIVMTACATMFKPAIFIRREKLQHSRHCNFAYECVLQCNTAVNYDW